MNKNDLLEIEKAKLEVLVDKRITLLDKFINDHCFIYLQNGDDLDATFFAAVEPLRELQKEIYAVKARISAFNELV